jgi:signal transduction histidine kinase
MGLDRAEPSWWSDTGIAAAVAVIAVGGAVIAPPDRSSLDLVGYLLPATAALSLIVRRRAPAMVLLITVLCSLGYTYGGYPGVLPAVPLLVALYTAVDAGRRRLAIAFSGTAFFGGLAIDLALSDGPGREVAQQWGLLAGWLIAAKVLGEVTRHRRGYLRQVEQRAIDAERTREETARRRASEERLRIARELHDSLTHSISVIKVQVGVAIHLYRKHDEEVPPVLVAIQEASAEAMRELRATLEVLRAEEPPATGLDRLDELVERARSAGLPVTVRTSGEPRPLPAEVDQAAYRIVQEAITNVARHAGPAAASVHIGYAEQALTVRIDDDGRGDEKMVPGVGLTGMQERVMGLGGRLQAGPRSDGGFTVQAELPVDQPVGQPS